MADHGASDVGMALAQKSRRLESWKEIAAYLERNVRTVQRWERQEALPIHRFHHSKMGSVYALPAELDAWRESRKTHTTQQTPSSDRARFARHRLLLGMVAVLTVGLAIAGVMWFRSTGRYQSTSVVSRLVAPETYRSYLRGRFQLNKPTAAGVEGSVQFFQEAIAADPEFASAYAGLARAYDAMARTSVSVSSGADVLPKTIMAANRALELDPSLAEAHAVQARAAQKMWQWKAAEQEYRRAIELDPNDAAAHSDYAAYLTWQGRTDEALVSARRALELDPLALDQRARLGWLLYHARRYDEAVQELQTVLAVEPENVQALWFLGVTFTEDGRLAEATQTLERAAAISHRSSNALAALSRAYACAGQRRAALQILDELKLRQRTHYVPAAVFIIVYMGLGEYEQAFTWLERAYQKKDDAMQFLKVNPLYDPVRGDPRFADLLRRVGL